MHRVSTSNPPPSTISGEFLCTEYQPYPHTHLHQPCQVSILQLGATWPVSIFFLSLISLHPTVLCLLFCCYSFPFGVFLITSCWLPGLVVPLHLGLTQYYTYLRQRGIIESLVSNIWRVFLLLNNKLYCSWLPACTVQLLLRMYSVVQNIKEIFRRL